MSAKRVNKSSVELLIFVSTLLVLLLTVINIEGFLNQKNNTRVLGTETTIDTNDEFWTEFLTKNPDYIPGWIEVGRPDRAKEIDPNYIIP